MVSALKKRSAANRTPLRVGFVTLGCAKNLVDSEVMLGVLSRERYEITTDMDKCDIAIVNTCGFIDSARKESVNEILELADKRSSGKIKRLIVTGCLSQKYNGDLSKQIPEIDALLGTGELDKIHHIIESLNGHKPTREIGYPTFLYDHTSPRYSLTGYFSRYVKIAEGCNHTCSFCIIPQMRGAYRSRPVESVLSEVKNMVKQGLREASLISQETTYYGRDIDRTYHLPKLLEQLNKIDGLKWIRLFYNHPQHMVPEIIDAIAQNEKVLPYIDMPLQHINDRLLMSMRRGVTKEKTIKLIDMIRSRIPNAVLRTTFIVGYPGETDREFQELCQFVKSTQFDHVGVFTYSRERDVSSGHLPDQIPSKVKKSRYEQLMSIQQPISFNKNKSFVGKQFEVLIEQEGDKPGWYVGRSYRQAPEVDGLIFVNSEFKKRNPGEFVNTRITHAMPYDLIGKAS